MRIAVLSAPRSGATRRNGHTCPVQHKRKPDQLLRLAVRRADVLCDPECAELLIMGHIIDPVHGTTGHACLIQSGCTLSCGHGSRADRDGLEQFRPVFATSAQTGEKRVSAVSGMSSAPHRRRQARSLTATMSIGPSLVGKASFGSPTRVPVPIGSGTVPLTQYSMRLWTTRLKCLSYSEVLHFLPQTRFGPLMQSGQDSDRGVESRGHIRN